MMLLMLPLCWIGIDWMDGLALRVALRILTELLDRGGEEMNA